MYNLRLSDRSRSLSIALLAVTCLLQSSAALAQSDETTNLEWPLELETEKGKVVVYQPQLESLVGDMLRGRAAVSVTPKGGTAPSFGAIWFDSRLSTDMDERLVTLEELTVTDAKFPDVTDAAKIEEFKRFLGEEIPRWHYTFSLDRLLAGMELVEKQKALAADLNHEPPEIIFATEPSVLVLVDGDPMLRDFEETGLKFVLNTPFMIVVDEKAGRYYLKGATSWYVASKLEGEWSATNDLPKPVAEIAKQVAEQEKQLAEANKAEATEGEATEPEPARADTTASGEPLIPKVVLRTHPAELIQVRGEPEFASIEGTQLLYLSNTENDMIMDITSQQYHVLLSGRWYRTKSLSDGPWEFVANDALPEEFQKIPVESDMADVRASVAGTDEANEAVLENSIPQTAAVDRKEAKVEVKYEGDPKFEKCGEAEVYYAVNTDKAVFLIDKTYYCCDEAIWFVSKEPSGSWEVATELPEAIQELPPDCPHYNVKYVYIYDSTPEVVYVGYTPGYVGVYPYGGVVVYGTGYWYPPPYPHYYYPRPVTYGFGVHYNPYTGWGYSVGVSNGWMHIGFSFGGYPYHGGMWGPVGYRHGYRHGYGHGYHHGYHAGARAGYRAGPARAGYRAGQRNGNLYRQRPGGIRHTGNQPRPSNRARVGTGTGAGRNQAAVQPKRTPNVSKQKNNVYTDRSGNVHRKQGDQWQSRDQGKWSSSNRSTQSTQKSRESLNRESQARQRGTQRSNQYKSSRPSTSQSRQGGARPSGGRSGGGGRRR